MDTLSFNTNLTGNSYSANDVLSVFKQTTEKNLNIHQGMSVKEISDVVAQKIITVIKEQFEATKNQIEMKEKK